MVLCDGPRERRLKACKQLGMRRIDVRRYGSLTAAERREIELEENLHRKDLTPLERSKTVTELAESATSISPKSGEKDPRGRKPKAAISESAAAKRIGIPQQTINLAAKHVAAAEKYPLLQGDDWSQKRAVPST